MNKKMHHQSLKLADSHAHLNLYPNQYLNLVVNKIEENSNLQLIINVATCVDSYFTSKSIKSSYFKNNNKIQLSLGIHPGNAHSYDHSIKKKFEDALEENLVVAIGETGLDFYKYAKSEEEKENQIQVFIDQIKYSQDLNLPLIIHIGKAFEDSYKILKKYLLKKDQIQGVIHCFSGDVEYLKKFIKLGFFISFSGNLTFSNAQNIQEAFIECPLNHMVLETDSPYLTPKPFRGFFPNEPNFIEYIAQFGANLKKIDLNELSEATFNNTLKLFKIKM